MYEDEETRVNKLIPDYDEMSDIIEQIYRERWSELQYGANNNLLSFVDDKGETIKLPKGLVNLSIEGVIYDLRHHFGGGNDGLTYTLYEQFEDLGDIIDDDMTDEDIKQTINEIIQAYFEQFEVVMSLPYVIDNVIINDNDDDDDDDWPSDEKLIKMILKRYDNSRNFMASNFEQIFFDIIRQFDSKKLKGYSSKNTYVEEIIDRYWSTDIAKRKLAKHVENSFNQFGIDDIEITEDVINDYDWWLRNHCNVYVAFNDYKGEELEFLTKTVTLTLLENKTLKSVSYNSLIDNLNLIGATSNINEDLQNDTI